MSEITCTGCTWGEMGEMAAVMPGCPVHDKVAAELTAEAERLGMYECKPCPCCGSDTCDNGER